MTRYLSFLVGTAGEWDIPLGLLICDHHPTFSFDDAWKVHRQRLERKNSWEEAIKKLYVDMCYGFPIVPWWSNVNAEIWICDDECVKGKWSQSCTYHPWHLWRWALVPEVLWHTYLWMKWTCKFCEPCDWYTLVNHKSFCLIGVMTEGDEILPGLAMDHAIPTNPRLASQVK